jgi:hypothetical protein
MSNTLTIPAEAVPVVRKALFCLMGDGTEAIAEALVQRCHERHPEWFTNGRELLQHVFAVLDLIGWADGQATPDIDVDATAHSQTVRAASEAYLSLLAGQEELADVDDPRRMEQGKPPLRQRIIDEAAALREVASRAGYGAKDPPG